MTSDSVRDIDGSRGSVIGAYLTFCKSEVKGIFGEGDRRRPRLGEGARGRCSTGALPPTRLPFRYQCDLLLQRRFGGPSRGVRVEARQVPAFPFVALLTNVPALTPILRHR